MNHSLFVACFFLIGHTLLAQKPYEAYVQLSYAELDSIEAFYYDKGVFDSAMVLMEAAQQKAEADYGQLDSTFAKYTDMLAYYHYEQGNYSQAEQMYLQAKDIVAKALGKEHPDYAHVLTGLATVYQGMGEYERAITITIEAKEKVAKLRGKEHPDYARSLNNLAAMYIQMGNYEKGILLLSQSKDIIQAILGEEHPYFAISLNNLGYLYNGIGDYEKALKMYAQARAIREKVYGTQHPSFAESLNNIALVYEARGEYEKALPLQIQTKNIRAKTLGTMHLRFAASLNNLGTTYMKLGQYEQAIPLYVQTQAIWEKVLGPKHPNFAGALNNTADAYLAMGQYEKAWHLMEEAINSLLGRALTHNFDKEWLEALQKEVWPSKQHTDRMLGALDLAYQILQQEGGTEAQQKQSNISSLSLFLLRQERKRLSNEQDKLRVLIQSNYWLLKKIDALDASHQQKEAFEAADQNKSVLLLQATQSQDAYRLGGLPDSLVWEDKRLLRERSKLQAKLLENREEEQKKKYIDQLNEVNGKLVKLEGWVKQQYPKYYQYKYQHMDIQVAHIQKLLDERTVLIEYLIADSVLHIFSVDKKGLAWHQEPLSKITLFAKIKAFHKSLSTYEPKADAGAEQQATYTELAHWFYQKLLQPVLKGDDGIENLIIISDGELGHLPFESFLVEPAPAEANYKDLHYLLKDFNISYNYSATLWKENKTAEAQENNGELFAMAARYSENPDSSLLRSRLASAWQVREGLQPLPAARREVEVLSEQYQGYFAFDSLATERTLREKAADYAIIHLATHGLLDEKRPVLSSLALTEDGDSLYDNFWQAHEISKMELRANLVVLSACETGYGRFETGNGIASLARSFMYAGVPSLVVSLWQVNDASTSIIMQNFYAHLEDGVDKAQALRQAKLDYITQVKNPIAAHPAFWSPFILMGDTEPVDLAERGGFAWSWYALGAGALLLSGLLFGLARRREAA